MKFALIACSIVAPVIGFTLPAFGQDHALSLPDQPGYAATSTGIGATSKTATGAAPSATPDEESSTAEHDDALYRGKTSETLGDALYGEGPLHFKTHPKERVREVDSLKKLQSTATDPKFQGSFAISGVSSIDKVAEKAKPVEEAAPQTEQEGDPRFVRRHLTFTPEQEDKTAKPAADSSPSATPSPTASPAKKKSSDNN
jgi:hypothetical protein